MSNTTVAQFAAELNRPVDDLLKQLKEAGVNKNSGNDSLTTDDKQLLTAYLQKKNGSNSGTISIRRKKTEVSTVDGVKVETRRRSRAVTIPSSEELAAEAKAKVAAENQKAEAEKAAASGQGAGKLPTASAVVADIIASARHKNKNVPMGWGSEKAKVEDIKESTLQYFVRFSGNDTALIEKCKKDFGEVKVLQLEGEDEFAILTGTMKEDDFKQIVEKIPETIKFIRAIL